MLFRKIFDCCIRCFVCFTVLVLLTNLLLHSAGVMGQSTKLAFDEEKDVETFKVTVGDNTEQMVGSASNVDRKYTSRVKLFDDIFNVKFKDKCLLFSSLQYLQFHLFADTNHCATTSE